jgi:two-component system chemotaxis response regulator CheY
MQVMKEIEGINGGCAVSAPEIVTESAAAVLHGRPHLLYAEDDCLVRQCISGCLRAAGYSVTAVESGEEAWDRLWSKGFDLLITDQRMPGMTGLDLISKARFEGVTAPVIVAASDVEPYNHALRRELRISEVLRKPFTARVLLTAVERALLPPEALMAGPQDERHRRQTYPVQHGSLNASGQ